MVKLHLSKFKVNLIADERKSVPSLRTIKIFSDKDDSRVLSYIKIDERMYNTIQILDEVGQSSFKGDPITDFIRAKFHTLKESNPSYGDFEDGYDKMYGYQGSIPLYVEDFFNYLKTENRDTLISDILK